MRCEPVDVATEACLGVGVVGQVDADLLIGTEGEAGAVEGVGSGSAPRIVLADLCHRIRNDRRDVTGDGLSGRRNTGAIDRNAAELIGGNIATEDGPVGSEPPRLVLTGCESVPPGGRSMSAGLESAIG